MKKSVTVLFVVFALAALQGVLARAETITYTYDLLNRVTQVQYGSGTTINYTYDPSGNRLTQTINAVIQNVLLTVTDPVNGTVTGNGINCPGDCTEPVASGTNVVLTANPAAGFQVDTWTGCQTVNGNECTVSMTQARTVTVAFTPLDTIPDAFSFTAQTGVALNTAVTSNTITVSGINAASSISITAGGSYSVNGGAFTTVSGTVNNGNTVAVRLTTSGSFSTQTCATLTIGGVQGSFCATTVNPAFDYTLSNTGNITVTQGSSGSNTITRNLVTGTSQAVTLSASGMPSGATPSFSNNPCNPACLSTLTISTSASTPTGTFPITVSGSPLNKSTSFNLVVNPQVTFSTADLEGTWHVYSLDASGIEGEVGGWSYGTLTINTTGTVTGGSLTDASGNLTTISNGLVSITADGYVIGDLTGTPGTDLIEMNATMLSDKDVIIGVATNQWIDGAKTGFDFSHFWAVKETGAVFAQSDLAGTWQFYGLTTPETAGNEGAWAYGTLTIDNSGTVNGSFSEPNKNFLVTGGNLALGTDGLLTGTVTSQSNPETRTTTVQATMLPDKDTVVGVGTTNWVEGTVSGKDLGLFVLFRATTQTFDQSDLTGTWRVYDLDIESTEGNLGIWKAGVVSFDSTGTVTNGSVIDAGGNGTTISGGPLTLSPSGALTGTLTGSPGPDSIAVNATMAPAKELIVGVTTVDWVDGTETGKDYGLFALIREATSNPQPGDITGPSLEITSHSNGQTVSTSTITVAGTATDSGHGDSGISSVTVNGVAASGGSASGSGTANWSRAITLNQGANIMTVVARDNSTNQNSAIQSIVVNYADTTLPVPGPVTPSNTRYGSFVDSPFDLNTTFTDNESAVTSCEYTTNGGVSWSPATISGTLPNFTCTKTGITGSNGQLLTLNMRATSQGGTSQGTAVQVRIDSAAPTGSIKINSNAAFTNSTSVKLSLSASDSSGVAQMCISNTTSCSTWEAYSKSKNWSLPSGDGTKTVYIWFKDRVGNTNVTPFTDQITLDTVPPTNPTTVTSSSHTLSVWSKDRTVDMIWSGATDDRSGVYGYSLKWDRLPSTLPDTTSDTTSTKKTSSSLSDGNNHYFHIRTRDKAGNWTSGAVHLGPFFIDGTAPVNGVLNAAAGNAQVSLNWSGFSDALTGLATANTYKLVFRTSGNPSSKCTNGTQIFFGTGTSFVHSGLINGTTYYYRLCAFDNVGNVSTGATASAIPQ